MTAINYSGTNHGAQVGINNGTFTAEIHYPERPETPPFPLSTVPFKRDADFVSRDKLLGRIQEKSSATGSRIALVGLGGVGKSQLAIEYSYRLRSRSPDTWVFWVHGSSAARFEQSFQDIADQVKIPNRRDPNTNVLELVEDWLRDERKGKWVLILDNVDDDELLVKRQETGPGETMTKPLLQYLPTSLKGDIIITSRSRDVALKVVDYRDLIEIEPMEKSEGLELLHKKLEESQVSAQLVDELECMPLAIVQAASYIRKLGPLYSVSRYLEDFRKGDRDATILLKKEANLAYRDWEASNSVLVTWQMSFDHIRRTKPSAADLLSLMCFFDRQEIREKLLRIRDESSCNPSPSPSPSPSRIRGFLVRAKNLGRARPRSTKQQDKSETPESARIDDFKDSIATLRDYSFISLSEDGMVITMHRLVQLATRIWLEAHGDIKRWKGNSVQNLFDVFPTGEYKNWEKCRSLLPHVKLAMSQGPESLSPESRKAWASLLHKCAYYALMSGYNADMIEMATKAMEMRMELLGEGNEKTLDSISLVSSAYYTKGRIDMAETFGVQVLELSKKSLGNEHPDTLNQMSKLALIFSDQQRYEEAERLESHAMKIRRKKLGDDHPDTIKSMSYLALKFLYQERYEEAEKIQVQVVNMSRMRLGDDDPYTIGSMASLASNLRNQARYEEAEELQLKVVELSRTKLGENHPDHLTYMNDLGWIYNRRGRHEEAEKIQVQTLEIRKKNLGDDHPDTLTSMHHLASTWLSLGRKSDAVDILEDCVARQTRVLGPDNAQTLLFSDVLKTWKKRGPSY